MGNYTKSIQSGFYDMIEKDITDIWSELNINTAAITSEDWKAYFTSVVAKYKVSMRFALMRILFEIASDLPPEKITDSDLKKGFSVQGIGDFPDITICHAEELDPAEIQQYKDLLLKRVTESNPKGKPRLFEQADTLIDSALALPAEGSKSLLSREQIILLGHLVDFSYADMQFLLLRVLGDNKVGFSFSASSDLIDIYCFLKHKNADAVNRLKRWYANGPATCEKVEEEEKSICCTQDIANSLENRFLKMKEKKFQFYMTQNASVLDLKPKTAHKVYLNLAGYASLFFGGFTIHDDTVRALSNFNDEITKLMALRGLSREAKSLFFTNFKPDAEKCGRYADILVSENCELATDFSIHERDKKLFYHVPFVDGHGKVNVRGTLNNNIQNRITRILMGETAPQKSDILYLLWVVAGFQWIGEDTGSAAEKRALLNDFLAAASCVLKAALLPAFYPPSVLEQTILTSIVQEGPERSPAVVYEDICSAFVKKRNR